MCKEIVKWFVVSTRSLPSGTSVDSQFIGRFFVFRLYLHVSVFVRR